MSNPQNKAFESWDKFLNPVTLKQSLIEASVFLTVYEMFRQSVIENLRSFYSDGFKDGKFTQSANYKTKVLDLYPRDVFHASCLWFQQSSAIDQSDLDIIQRIRDHRNAMHTNSRSSFRALTAQLRVSYSPSFSNSSPRLNVGG